VNDDYRGLLMVDAISPAHGFRLPAGMIVPAIDQRSQHTSTLASPYLDWSRNGKA